LHAFSLFQLNTLYDVGVGVATGWAGCPAGGAEDVGVGVGAVGGAGFFVFGGVGVLAFKHQAEPEGIVPGLMFVMIFVLTPVCCDQ
jgi:hypothetical protein